jgi:hypothetical protein
MKNLKTKTFFWLPFIYIMIVLFNLGGFDDMNLVLFFTSPFGWIAETHWFVVNFIHPAKIHSLIIILSLVIWFFVGLIIDLVIKKIKKN